MPLDLEKGKRGFPVNIVSIELRPHSARRYPGTVYLKPVSTFPALVTTRQQVQCAKPDPDLFLAAAQQRNIPIARAMVVGDSVWNLLAARRAGFLGIGLLQEATGRDNWSRWVRIECIRTRRTYSLTSMK